MKRNSMLLLLVVFSLALALPTAAGAAPQSGTQLTWFLPLSGVGGQSTSATSQVSFTIGQSVVGNSVSRTSTIGLGFWQGASIPYRQLVPLVKK